MNLYRKTFAFLALLCAITPCFGFKREFASPNKIAYQDGPTWKQVVGELLKEYKDTVRFDHTYKLTDGRVLKVKFRHYCTFDGQIVIPHRYLRGDTKLKSFKTHNFQSSLYVSLNSKTIFHGFITKDDFKSEFRDSLKQYATLSYAGINVVNGVINIDYSLSIPLTDLGKGVTIRIDLNGNKVMTPERKPKTTQAGILRPATPLNVMAVLFGTYDPKTKASVWACTNEALLRKFKVPANTRFVGKLAFVDSVSIDNVKELFIITASRPVGDSFDCHGCDVQLEFYQFGPVVATRSWGQTDHQMIYEMGSYGDSPPIELKKIGKDRYGFLFRPGFTGQGITTESVYLYTNRFDGFKQILKIEDAAMDNSGACDDKVPGSCWQYSYTLNVIDAQQAYNDLVFTQKGTKEVNGKKVSANATVKYHFAGTAYVAVK